jgi:hypothetical protein
MTGATGRASALQNKLPPTWNRLRGLRFISPCWRTEAMLVERGLQVMNVEVVGDAYAIASNYLRKAGTIPDTFATDEQLLEIIVNLFQRGEFNRIRLANKAIAKFEADRFYETRPITILSA